MNIRVATIDDAEVLIQFNLAMALETEALQLDPTIVSQGVNTLLRQPQRGFYLVAERNQERVGSLMVTYEWSDWQAKDYYWIQSVYIRPQDRRQGIYRRLYQTVKEYAHQQGAVASFRLYVEKDNITAQDTYRSLGMHPSHYMIFEEK